MTTKLRIKFEFINHARYRFVSNTNLNFFTDHPEKTTNINKFNNMCFFFILSDINKVVFNIDTLAKRLNKYYDFKTCLFYDGIIG